LQSSVSSRISPKLSTVVEEADESAFWMEVLIEAEVVTENELGSLLKEANEILKIVSASRKTVSR
jgi:four helix bundle protein